MTDERRWEKARLLHSYYGLSSVGVYGKDLEIALQHHDLVSDYLIRHPEIEQKWWEEDEAWKKYDAKVGPCPEVNYGYYQILNRAEKERDAG
jgi:hypothetical protein